jgi:hypothetical protein
MHSLGGRSISLLVGIAGVFGCTPALAQPPEAAITWDVPCGDRWAFVAGVAELGGSFEGFDVSVGVVETEAGSFRGRLSVARGSEPLADRELEDAECADVVDALVIAAALTLRSLRSTSSAGAASDAPVAPLPPDTITAAPPDDEVPPTDAPIVEPRPATSARFALGASFRGGLGPTPGVSLAPVLAISLEVERVLVTLDLAYWPEAGATLADGQRGVALWALTPTLELGYRIGDAFSVVPAIVIEPSAAIAHGVGVPSPRSEATLALDAGGALYVTLDLDRVRLFVRGDVLFGLVQPVYGVEGERVFASPTVRGTGGAGLFVFL